MARFVVGDERSQSTLFPERLDDYLGETILLWCGSRLGPSIRRCVPQFSVSLANCRPANILGAHLRSAMGDGG